MYVLFYIFGAITTAFFIGMLWYKRKSKELSTKVEYLTNQNESLLKYKIDRESMKRLARYRTSGWHLKSEADNPNKTTWDTVFELKEVAQSEDNENLLKFKVVAVYSENNKDAWGTENYTKWFMSNTGGGWIDTTKDNFEWITSFSKLEMREDKLNDLGID